MDLPGKQPQPQPQPQPTLQSEPPRQTFLVERYWPGIDEKSLRSALPRLERAARAMTAEGIPVGHVASILMPADEVVFSLITAATEAVVRQLNERAELPADRIAGAIALPGAGGAGLE